jgi:glycosyltransferase involved in cell wall biosynthesis
MHLSVVVCTYNRAASLRRTLDALDAQVTPPPLAWEVVIVDNNSTDATRAEVERFAGRARMPVRSVFVARQGLSHARNAGLAEVRGAIVAFTDDDVDPLRDWVAHVAGVMDEARADVLGGRIVPAWIESPPRWLADRPNLLAELAILDHPTPTTVEAVGATPNVWGANMAFRRGVFEGLGGFDTRRGIVGHKLYRGEESELVGRALAAGFRVVYDPRPVVRHRIGRDRTRLAYLSRLYLERAEGDGLLRPRLGPRTLWRALGAPARPRADPLAQWFRCCEAVGVVSAAFKRYGRAPWGGGTVSVERRPADRR